MLNFHTHAFGGVEIVNIDPLFAGSLKPPLSLRVNRGQSAYCRTVVACPEYCRLRGTLRGENRGNLIQRTGQAVSDASLTW